MPLELPNNLRHKNYYLVLSPGIKILSVLVKISSKTETELFPYSVISHEKYGLFQIFCE